MMRGLERARENPSKKLRQMPPSRLLRSSQKNDKIRLMLVIRLSKTGKKGEAKYRVVVKEKRDRRDGLYVENLGWYTKLGKNSKKEVKMDRVKFWISQGAQPSPTVKKLLEI